MADIKNGQCNCKDCTCKRDKLQQQLDHPFYKKVDEFREEIKLETLKKAAEKYNEPFDPASWTIEQLAKHAMAENYDQSNYIYGMYERLQEQQKTITELAWASDDLFQENEKVKYAIAENCELRQEIERLKAIEHLYNLEMGKQSELVGYLQQEFKSVWQPGEHCIDVAIAALVQEKNAVNFWIGQYASLKRGTVWGPLGAVVDEKA